MDTIKSFARVGFFILLAVVIAIMTALIIFITIFWDQFCNICNNGLVSKTLTILPVIIEIAGIVLSVIGIGIPIMGVGMAMEIVNLICNQVTGSGGLLFDIIGLLPVIGLPSSGLRALKKLMR